VSPGEWDTGSRTCLYISFLSAPPSRDDFAGTIPYASARRRWRRTPASYVGLVVAGRPVLPAWLLLIVPALVITAHVIRLQRLQQHTPL
jgi:hypothetical protein